MGTTTVDARLSSTYEALLTALCQCGLASTRGWCLPVADPEAARFAVVTWALAFGDPLVRSLAATLEQHVDRSLLNAPLTPEICRGLELDGVLHLTAGSMKLQDQLKNKDVIVWDAGRGSRMGRLLQPGQAKGEIKVAGDHKLYEFAAGAAQWLVSALRALNRDYVAFVAADQILCLSESDGRGLATLLDTASLHETDVIFFDGPPALSLLLLRFLLDSNRPPRRNGTMALTRDRQMLKNYGGAHVFQCVLLRSNLAAQLLTALEAVLNATRKGCDVDLGVGDIAVLPRLRNRAKIN